MIEGHRRCLESLDSLTSPDGEFCTPFRPIEQDTGYDRRTVRRYVRALARKGLAEYFKGLTTEDGEFAGAGYCITREGSSLIESLPRKGFPINMHGTTTGRFSGENLASNPPKAIEIEAEIAAEKGFYRDG